LQEKIAARAASKPEILAWRWFWKTRARRVHNMRGMGLWMGCMPLKWREIFAGLFD
jgi:hypothetical protein